MLISGKGHNRVWWEGLAMMIDEALMLRALEQRCEGIA